MSLGWMCLVPWNGALTSSASITRTAISDLLTSDVSVLSADIQSSQGGSPNNVRREHQDLGSVVWMIDDVLGLNADGATSHDTDIVGSIVIR